MELLLQEQFKTYNHLLKLHKNFKENPCVAKGDFTARIELITKYYKKFGENNDTIEKIFAKHKVDTNKEEYFKQDLAFKCELLYVSMKGELLESQSVDNTTAVLAAETLKVPSKEDDKEEKEKTKPSDDLPKLDIRNFSGKITDWIEFRKEYFENVHSNSDLSDSQKFSFLKSVLPDDVFEIIKLIFTSRNETGYEEAWAVLEENFNKKKLIKVYLNQLMQQPCINGLPKSIARFLDQIIQSLNQLQSLNVDTKNWDVLLVHIFVQKLNDRTKTEWYSTHSSCELPKLYDFFVFLNSKISNTPDDLSEEIKKFNYEADSSHNNFGCCVCCKRRHPLWQCDKFESMSIDERQIFVKNKTICVRCLSTQHTFSECTKPYTCRICQKKEHHYLLHKNAKRSQ